MKAQLLTMPVDAHAGLHRREKINVLFVIDELREMGGGERVLIQMIRALPADRYRPVLVTFRIDRKLPFLQAIPCPVHVLPLRRTYGWSGLRCALAIRKLIRENKTDILHTFFETSDLWVGAIARLGGGPAQISSRRDMGILRSWKHKMAYRLLSGQFAQVQCVSEHVRRFAIESDGLAPERVVTIHNGLPASRIGETSDRAAARRALGLESASHVISTIAHIRKVKGVDVYLRMAARMIQQFPEAVFLVAGENHQPGHYKELMALTASLGLQRNVRFLGDIGDVSPVLHASDVFCLLSRNEGLSNALLEAMAAGLPCVATSVGGNPELVEPGVNGVLVANEDYTAAAEAASFLFGRPEEARRMGENGRARVREQFSEQAMMQRLQDQYEALMASNKRTNGRGRQ